MTQLFQSQLLSLITEGAFNRHPELKITFLEGGCTWIPSFIWRMDKEWKGLRHELPWLTEPPSAYIHKHVRFTTQPMDMPEEERYMAEIIDQMGSDDLLMFSTDYPRHHFDEQREALVEGVEAALTAKIMAGSARSWYGLPAGRWTTSREIRRQGMTDTLPEAAEASRRKVPAIDYDIHNALPDDATFRKYLPAEWHDYHWANGRRGYVGSGYPRAVPHAARVDSWPPLGLVPGADLDFMREQLLDHWDFEYGILNCLSGGGADLNLSCAAALSRAMNDWQVAEWLEPEPRLRASLIVPYEDADLAVAEIERMGDHPGFVQIMLVCRTREPLGHWKYWKMYETAVRHGLAVGIHFGGAGGGPITGAGWPTHYMEDHAGMSQAFQSQVASYALSGVFDRLPDLKIVLIEGGFA